MNRTNLKTAIQEAERFLRRANELDAQTVACRLIDHPDAIVSFPRQQAALKRASMDLTRALADLRRRGT